MEEELVRLLVEKNATISTAESCTGGLLMGTLINVSGVSQVVKEGFITYSNDAKQKYLKVSSKTLEQYGAVSEQTAKEMAVGLHQLTKAQVCLTTTGIAGPDGGTDLKPVGTIYIGCYCFDKVYCKKLMLDGDRQANRKETVNEAIKYAISILNQ